MGYPIILGGDHAEFEAEWTASGKPDNERPDWPLPSFDAQDWAAHFCTIATDLGYKDAGGSPIDEGWMVSWFANALMRGFDEHASRCEPITRKKRWGFKSKTQLPLFMIWEEIWECGEVIHANVLFNTRDWIGL